MNGVEKRAKNEGAESSTTHVPLNTSQSAISSHRKVIIIGAGSTGLALAHGLKKAGIPFVIFEKEVRGDGHAGRRGGSSKRGKHGKAA